MSDTAKLESRAFKSAANLVLGKSLRKLYMIAEKQSSISGTKLTKMLEDAHEELKNEGVLMRDICRALRGKA